MKTIIPGLIRAIPPHTESMYAQDLATAVVAAAALAAVLVITWLVIRATYVIVRILTEAARMPATMAGRVTTALVTTMVIIGLLNR